MLPTMCHFQTLKPYSIIFIDENTCIQQISHLIPVCDEATDFSIYSEKDSYSALVISISIEIIQSKTNESMVIILMPERLPRIYSSVYMIIRTFLRSIFSQNKKIRIWDYHTGEDLIQFFHHKYLEWTCLTSINYIPVISQFKQWYKRNFQCPPNLLHSRSISLHKRDHRWHLHVALRLVTGEYIFPNSRERMQPAILSCMAITKLSFIFELNWTGEQIKQFNRYHQS